MAFAVAKENFHPHYGSFWLKVSLSMGAHRKMIGLPEECKLCQTGEFEGSEHLFMKCGNVAQI